MGDSCHPRPLGEYLTLQRGNTYKSHLLGYDGPFLLGLSSIERNGGFRISNLKTYGGLSDENILLGPGDIYVSLKDVTQSADLLGAVARVPKNVPRGRLTQDTVKLVFNDDDAPKNYIYWLLRTPQYRAFCRSHATGTTNLGLPRDDFLSFKVPPFTYSRQLLCETLQCLDDKIDLNRRMNETLEAMARAIFKDWFVDFGPTRAKAEGRAPYLAPEIWNLFPDTLDDGGKPQGWEWGRLADVADAPKRTVRPSEVSVDTPYIGLEHMPRHSVALSSWETAQKVTSNKTAFNKSEFLFGKLRPYFHKVGIAPINGIASTDIVVLTPKSYELSAFTLCCLSSEPFVEYTTQTSTGTKMPRTSWKLMAQYQVCISHTAIMKAFQKTVGPLFEKVISNIQEIQTLSQTRDLLLPKLMSGEIRLRDAEKVVEAVA